MSLGQDAVRGDTGQRDEQESAHFGIRRHVHHRLPGAGVQAVRRPRLIRGTAVAMDQQVDPRE